MEFRIEGEEPDRIVRVEAREGRVKIGYELVSDGSFYGTTLPLEKAQAVSEAISLLVKDLEADFARMP